MTTFLMVDVVYAHKTASSYLQKIISLCRSFMISDSFQHTVSVFCFVTVVIIPALLLTPFLVLRDLAIYLLSFRKSSATEPLPITDTESHPWTSNPGITDMSTKLKAASGPVIAALKLGSRPNTSTIQGSYSGWASTAASYEHLAGIPRRVVISSVAAFSCIVTSLLNRVKVHNIEKLQDLIQNRPPNTPLITISNHMSTLDDPLMWGIWRLRCSDPKLCRWTLTAKDICFTNPYISYFFRLGKCIPIDRWGSVHQECMYEAIDLIDQGEWLHTFPEGKIMQDPLPLQRLKWGVASVIARSSNPPILLCIGLSGFEKVMPEKHLFGRRSVAPLWGKDLSIVVGEPFQFDVAALYEESKLAVESGDTSFGKDCLAPIDVGTNKDSESIADDAENDLSALESAKAIEEKRKKIEEVGDEVTRRLYSEMSSRIRDKLQEVVLRAHDCVEKRGR